MRDQKYGERYIENDKKRKRTLVWTCAATRITDTHCPGGPGATYPSWRRARPQS